MLILFKASLTYKRRPEFGEKFKKHYKTLSFVYSNLKVDRSCINLYFISWNQLNNLVLIYNCGSFKRAPSQIYN